MLRSKALSLSRSHNCTRPLRMYSSEALNKTTQELQSWFDSDRFKDVYRPYTAAQVSQHRGSFPVIPPQSSVTANKLWNLLNDNFKKGLPVHTIGSVDPVQMSQSVKNQQVVYVSGWACSSLLTTTNEVGPDFGDYPYDTVPNQVERLFKAQLLHDRKETFHYNECLQKGKESEFIDYMRPIIADADTGHGGITTVMKLAKLFAENGAAAIHLEDQLHGGKKCGHLGGKVIVPTSTHITRLIATRFQWDLMNSGNLVIARTDSESSRLLSSSIDPSDHEFILGTTTKDSKPLSEVLLKAKQNGSNSKEIEELESKWLAENGPLVTIDEAVEQFLSSINSSQLTGEVFRKETLGKSLTDKLEYLKSKLDAEAYSKFHFDWDSPRTLEGYYHVKPGTDVAIKRTLAYAPYSDLLWLETKKPDLKQAQEIAAKIHSKYPSKMLVYNLSPSFNWSAQGYNEEDLKNFIWELGKSGFTLQLISLAGLHSNAVATWELSNRFKTEGMKAYVDLVQNKERELKCNVLTHQVWSGANYIDSIVNTVQSNGASGSAVGGDSTEHGF